MNRLVIRNILFIFAILNKSMCGQDEDDKDIDGVAGQCDRVGRIARINCHESPCLSITIDY